MRVIAFLLCCATLFGSQLANEKAYFSRERTEFRNQIPLSVDPITGEYSEVVDDLVIASAQPISYRRIYHNLGEGDYATGRWQINPQATCFFNFVSAGKVDECVMVGEASGSSFVYKKFSGHHCSLGSASTFANISASGQTHPLNTRISYNRIGEDVCFAYRGHIVTGDGRTRTFSTESRIWPQSSSDPVVMARSLNPGIFHARIDTERLPNGNVLTYSWKNCNPAPHAPYYLLEKITAWNSRQNLKLGEINLKYERAGPKHLNSVRHISVQGSDERHAHYTHDLKTVIKKDKDRKHPFIFDVLLRSAQLPDRPPQVYNFSGNTKRSKHVKDILKRYAATCNLTYTTTTDGVPITLAYDSSHRVTSLSSPLGVIASYAYNAEHTVVTDGNENKTIYHYDGDHRITAVEKYEGANLISTERSTWDASTGNLMKRELEDGQQILLKTHEYTYDEQHNPIVEKVGDGREWQITHRLFSQDTFNLLLEESNREGRKIRYTYIPHTNLPQSQFEIHHNKIVKRIFYTYDAELNSVCVRKITDDGSSENPHDLEGVSYRKVVETLPKRDMPCLGLPQEVREKTVDPSEKSFYTESSILITPQEESFRKITLMHSTDTATPLKTAMMSKSG